MIKIYSKKISDKLLHIINYRQTIRQDREDLTPENELLQVATICYPKGQTFRAHRHIYKEGVDQLIAQESWVVVHGSVKVFLYDLNDELLHTDILHSGGCSITFFGGHTFEILEDDTLVYEFKVGPYLGQAKDKVFLK